MYISASTLAQSNGILQLLEILMYDGAVLGLLALDLSCKLIVLFSAKQASPSQTYISSSTLALTNGILQSLEILMYDGAVLGLLALDLSCKLIILFSAKQASPSQTYISASTLALTNVILQSLQFSCMTEPY